jgi:hypothetical protein
MHLNFHHALLFASVLFFPAVLLAQSKITGKMTDANQNPIELAEIILMSADGIALKSEFSDANGNFILEYLNGNYMLQIKKIGKLLYSTPVVLDQDRDYGTITAQAPVNELSEVVVSSNKKLIERKGDRLVFNVEQSIYATGQNAAEVLKNTPRVDPSSESLKIIGKSSVMVMVNDRLLNLSGPDLETFLKSLRSDNIAKIEVISTPPASFDASGNSGLINIVLKKNTQTGLDGSLSGSYVQRTKPGFMPSANLAYSGDKLAVGLNFFADDEIRNAVSRIDIDYPSESRKSNILREDRSKGISTTLNIDYAIGPKANTGVIASVNAWDIGQRYQSIVRFEQSATQAVDRTQNLPSINSSKYTYLSFSPYYDIKLDTLGKAVKFNYNYLIRNNNDDRDFFSSSFDGYFAALTDQNASTNQSDGRYAVNTFNANIELPFAHQRFDFGAKFSLLENDSEIRFYDTTTGVPMLDAGQSNTFDYQEQIWAAYVSYEKPLGNKWFVKAGLRYEYTATKGNSVTTASAFENTFDHFFPTALLTYNPSERHSFSLGYSKRIDRPAFNDVNPFKVYLDYYNYAEGNPGLLPSLTHNIEFSYLFNNNLSFTLYGTLLKNGADYLTISSQGNPFIVSRPENFFDQKSIGFDVSHTWKPFANFSSYNTASAYYKKAESLVPQITIDDLDGYGCFVSTRNTYTLNKERKNRLYVNYYHQFPYVDGLKKVYTRASVTIGGSFTFLDKNLILNVAVSDIFRQANSKVVERYPTFAWRSNVYNDQRNLNLSLTYKFGNKKAKTTERNVDDSDKNRLN